MTGLDEFYEVFGNITLTWVVQVGLAIVFLVSIYRKVKKYLDEKREEERKQAETKAEREQNLDKAIKALEQLPKLDEEIRSLRSSQAEIMERLDKMETDSNRVERNKLRDRLLQSYRYYTSEERNPTKKWTRMESETFWSCFKDYEDRGGDGYMHSIVQTEMNDMEIVEMDDVDGVASLMGSRK